MISRTFPHIAAFGLILVLLTGIAFGDTNGGLQNPLNSQISNIPQFIAAALKILVMVSLPIIALIIVYSGFLFVFARGNESALSEARRNFMFVIIGTILILGAWTISNLLAGTIEQLTK